MRIAVLGTGVVGRTLARKTRAVRARCHFGIPSATNEAAVGWAAEAGARAKAATFADAAAEGEIVINATPGAVSLDVLAAASTKNLAGKVLVYVANPLDHSAGFPPPLAISNTDSLAETIQRAFPTARVVKALNTMRADVMVAPDKLAGGDHDVFMAGDDDDAKEVVAGLLREFGWQTEHIRDLGPLEAARGMEMLPLWLRIFLKQGERVFNIKVVSD